MKNIIAAQNLISIHVRMNFPYKLYRLHMQEKCYSYLKMFKREKKNFALLYCNQEICNVLNVLAKVFLLGYTFRTWRPNLGAPFLRVEDKSTTRQQFLNFMCNPTRVFQLFKPTKTWSDRKFRNWDNPQVDTMLF